jgi:hypothetical protein
MIDASKARRLVGLLLLLAPACAPEVPATRVPSDRGNVPGPATEQKPADAAAPTDAQAQSRDFESDGREYLWPVENKDWALDSGPSWREYLARLRVRLLEQIKPAIPAHPPLQEDVLCCFELDDKGGLRSRSVAKRSADSRVDRAVTDALAKATGLNEPPPEEVRVALQGRAFCFVVVARDRSGDPPAEVTPR